MSYTIPTLAKVVRNHRPDLALKLMLEQGRARLDLAKALIDEWRGGYPWPPATDKEAKGLLREIPLDVQSNLVADAILLALLKRDGEKANRLAADWLAQWAKQQGDTDPRPITLADGRALNDNLKETVAEAVASWEQVHRCSQLPAKVWEAVKGVGKPEVTVREVHRKLHNSPEFRTVDPVRKAMKTLEGMGYLKPLSTKTHGRPGRPSKVYRVLE